MSGMRADLREQVLARLVSDFRFKKSADGKHLQGGICPNCGKKELWTWLESPWVLQCSRENKCGHSVNIRELYPDLFANFNERFQPTADDPKATARAYLSEARGLNTAAIGEWYTQENYYHPKANRGTATVRFYIHETDGAYMERFVEPVEITAEDGSKSIRKQNFGGSYGGWWWCAPNFSPKEGEEVWITEAIIDSLSLIENGIQSVAILSCNNYPDKALHAYKGKTIKWVLALDNDKAGRSATLKHIKRMREEGFDT